MNKILIIGILLVIVAETLSGCVDKEEFNYDNDYVEVTYNWSSDMFEKPLTIKFLVIGNYTVEIDGKVIFNKTISYKDYYYSYGVACEEENLIISYDGSEILNINLE